MYFGGSTDFGFLPPGVNGDIQYFFSNNMATTLWQQWVKPKGITMCFMVCIAGGGGGGGGFSGASTTARGGGGSGACSCISTMLVPALFLPDVLKVNVGAGGLGGGPTVAGGNGTNSYIATGAGVTAGITIPNLILVSGVNAPGGGGAGTIAAAGAAGAIPTIAAKANIGWMGAWATTNFTVGFAGVIAGAQTGAVGTAITASWNTLPITPGSSGAGVNTVGAGFAGGAISLQATMDIPDGIFNSSILAGGVAGGAGAAGNGNAGIQCWKPFIMTGGTGGGSSDGSTGGIGGKGAIGCGGGGGGAGVTGGKGGDGGNGLVIIISW